MSRSFYSPNCSRIANQLYMENVHVPKLYVPCDDGHNSLNCSTIRTVTWDITKDNNKGVLIHRLMPDSDDCAYKIDIEYVGLSDDGRVASGSHETTASYRAPKGWRFDSTCVNITNNNQNTYTSFALQKYTQPPTSSCSAISFYDKNEKSLEIVCTSDFMGKFTASIRCLCVSSV